MSVVVAGIDEAGYGPMLGPLCVGMAALEIDTVDADDGWPDLWEALSAAVDREPRAAEKQGKIAVGDSKRLKLSNQLRTKHPLTHLERGALAFASCLWPETPATDADLLDHLGVQLGDHAWYSGPCADLPLSTTPDHLRVLGAGLRGALDRAGIRVLDLRCSTLTERAFNAEMDRLASKAAVAWAAVVPLLQRLWLSERATRRPAPRVMIDRQGGRRSYAGQLAAIAPGAAVEIVAENDQASVYNVRGAGDQQGRGLRVVFASEAEDRQLPVALASMIAKLVRELSMARFNAYWSGRLGELKPTAGYVQDARRWLEDARRRGGATEAELTSLCRRA